MGSTVSCLRQGSSWTWRSVLLDKVADVLAVVCCAAVYVLVTLQWQSSAVQVVTLVT